MSLRTLLAASTGADGVNKRHLGDAVGMNELDATAEKCRVLKDILVGLVDKHTGLEQRCMGLEEQTSRETLALKSKQEQLNEGMTANRRRIVVAHVHSFPSSKHSSADKRRCLLNSMELGGI